MAGPLVVALGGNALLRRGDPPEHAIQQRNVEHAATAIATLASGRRLVVTHGNGPQVGLLALTQEAARVELEPLDVLGSETQGMIGYLIEEAIRVALPGREAATLLTQVIVNRDDPAFAAPSKPIGPLYARADAERLAAERGWRIAPDGDGYRRVVPSPEPLRIVELAAIRLLVEHDVIVICGGGGGIPVTVTPSGAMYGIEAVVDKDFTAALLACALDAEALLLLTDVHAVESEWRTANARPIRQATPAQLRALDFAPGSMGPKVEAACRFAEATGRSAMIGALEEAPALLAGTAGTTVARGTAPLSWW